MHPYKRNPGIVYFTEGQKTESKLVTMARFISHHIFLLFLGLHLSVADLLPRTICLPNILDVYDYPSNNSTTISSVGPDLTRAKRYVYLVGASYCADTDTISAWNCKYCNQSKTLGYNYNAVLLNNTYDTMALVTVNENASEIVVTFRGSYNVPNFICDAVLTQVSANDSSGVLIHKGFLDATMSLYQQVVNTVSGLLENNPNYNLVLSGHSLGGAEAAVTAYMMSNGYNMPPGVTINPASWSLFTYGEPRVGNKALADWFNGKSTWSITRVTNNGDIVPHIPPVRLNYVHHGTELWTGSKVPGGSKPCSKTVYEDPCCSNAGWLTFNPVDHLTYFDMLVLTCDADDPINQGTNFVANFIFDLSANATMLPACLTNLMPSK